MTADVDAAVALCNRHSPRFVASLVSDDAAEHDRFYDAVDAPFVGDGFTRWVDGQYALDTPELGLSNWQGGRLLARGGVLSGESVHTVRYRARIADPDAAPLMRAPLPSLAVACRRRPRAAAATCAPSRPSRRRRRPRRRRPRPPRRRPPRRAATRDDRGRRSRRGHRPTEPGRRTVDEQRRLAAPRARLGRPRRAVLRRPARPTTRRPSGSPAPSTSPPTVDRHARRARPRRRRPRRRVGDRRRRSRPTFDHQTPRAARAPADAARPGRTGRRVDHLQRRAPRQRARRSGSAAASTRRRRRAHPQRARRRPHVAAEQRPPVRQGDVALRAHRARRRHRRRQRPARRAAAGRGGTTWVWEEDDPMATYLVQLLDRAVLGARRRQRPTTCR